MRSLNLQSVSATPRSRRVPLTKGKVSNIWGKLPFFNQAPEPETTIVPASSLNPTPPSSVPPVAAQPFAQQGGSPYDRALIKVRLKNTLDLPTIPHAPPSSLFGTHSRLPPFCLPDAA